MAAAPRPPPPPSPKALFAAWLREWRRRDRERGGDGRAYDRALRSLALYPLRLRSGREAAVLRHFGARLCRRLHQRLREHRAALGLPPSPSSDRAAPQNAPAPPPVSVTWLGRRGLRRGAGPRKPLPQSLLPFKPRPLGEYRPRPRSGPHALLLTLLRSPEPLPEAELLRQAQPLCDLPLAPGAPRGGALGVLIRRDLVQRSGRPPRCSLTPRGRLLAQRLAAAPGAPPPENPALPLAAAPEAPPPETPPPEAPPPEAPPVGGGGEEGAGDPQAEFELRPGAFTVLLCADVTEGTGPGSRGGAVPQLRLLGVPLELRRLPLGDFLWVARETAPPPGRRPRELVLEVVVERKTGADLGGSLCDGRYREQKFRLRRCGLRHPVLLLEALGGGHRALPLPTLRQAAASTQVKDGIFVKRTRDPRESAAYLGVLGELLQRRYGNRVLRAWGGDLDARPPPGPPGTPCALLSFERLREGGSKSQPQTVGDVFARQLLQLGGLGGAQAGAVLQRCGTPARLMAAYRRCPDAPSREALLRDTKWGALRRNLGPVLSRALAQLYGTPGPLQ